MQLINSLLKVVTVALILYFIILGLGTKITLTTADLGRHISNGKFIVEAIKSGADLQQTTPLYTNFYSYSEPDFLTTNHHWLTGVCHYLIGDKFGFRGLSVFNILLAILTAMFFFLSARLYSNNNIAFATLVLALPMIVWRDEIRPESFSYMLMGLQFYLLSLYRFSKINFKILLPALALLQLLWINLHVFFVFGLFILGVFALEAIWQGQDKRPYIILVITATLVSLLNPAGIYGLLEPFSIFQGYGYMLAENQSVFFMHKRFPGALIYYYYDFIVLVNVGMFILRRRSVRNDLMMLVIALVFMVLGFKTNRAMPIFVIYSIPILAANIYTMVKSNQRFAWLMEAGTKRSAIFYSALILITALMINLTGFKIKNISMQNLGLEDNINNSALFFKSQNIQGPIFNNYDIGGYLIYHLFPYRRVFVDNRPEAYSVEFFEQVYKPMQESEEKWREVDAKYKFNVIYYMRHDITEHAQPFLIRRIRDLEWAPVFVDAWTIILLKRNAQNQAIIDKHELPQSMFKSVHTRGRS